MKLYDVPRGELVRIVSSPIVPVDAPDLEVDDVIRLGNIDGMYSYCIDRFGGIVHLAAYVDVEIVRDEERAVAYWEIRDLNDEVKGE